MQQARIVLWMVIGVVVGGLTIVQAAEKQRSPHDRMMGMFMQQLKTVLNPNHVLGDALDFDGTKVVPIVRMGFGLSARHAAAQKSEDEDDDKEHGDEQEHDGEAGLHLRSFLAPVALLVVTKTGDVRVIGLPGGMAWRERAERTERPERARERPSAPQPERQ